MSIDMPAGVRPHGSPGHFAQPRDASGAAPRHDLPLAFQAMLMQCSVVDAAIALLWYRDHFTAECELSAEALCRQLLHIGRVSVMDTGFLQRRLRASDATVRNKRTGAFRLSARARFALAERYSEFAEARDAGRGEPPDRTGTA